MMDSVEYSQLWHWKLFSIDGKDILVSNIASASLLLILGIVVYRRIIGKAFTFLVERRFKHNLQDFYLLRKLINYISLIIYICFILNIANIPFTIFAFLGGAIAISLGLGAQNLIGDFINGFMVIIDKSVNIGDIIKIDNVIGKIEKIGIRYTKIRTNENSEFIVPNNVMINNKFIKLGGEKSLLKIKIYLKIENKNLKERDIEKKIIETLASMPELSAKLEPELYLIEIAQKTYKYQLNYYPKNLEKYNREYIQDLVNHALIEIIPNIEIKLPQA